MIRPFIFDEGGRLLIWQWVEVANLTWPQPNEGVAMSDYGGGGGDCSVASS